MEGEDWQWTCEKEGCLETLFCVVRSLLAQLDDPFTRFLEPSRYAALKRGTAGSLTGVGLEVGFDMGAGTDSDLLVLLCRWLLFSLCHYSSSSSVCQHNQSRSP